MVPGEIVFFFILRVCIHPGTGPLLVWFPCGRSRGFIFF